MMVDDDDDFYVDERHDDDIDDDDYCLWRLGAPLPPFAGVGGLYLVNWWGW